MAGHVINLRTARKRKKRREDDAQARINRGAFGRTLHERELDDTRQAKANREFINHRIEAGDRR